MKNVIKRLKLVLVIGMITMPTILMARDPLGDSTIGGGDPNPYPQNDAELPFDGGVSLLVAAGIGYGLKKVYDKRKAEKDSQALEN